jgi:hypothetical protein
MAGAKAAVRRVTFRFPDRDLIATVVRGVGFRFVCECGAQGSRRATWKEASVDMREHVLGHNAAAASAADE